MECEHNPAAMPAASGGDDSFRLVFEGSPSAIVWSDAVSGIIVNCNGATEELLNAPRARIIGTHRSLLHPPGLANFAAVPSQNAAIYPACPLEQTETIVLAAHDRRIPVLATHSLAHISGRDILQSVFTNIAEQKRLIEEFDALAHRQEAVQSVKDASPESATGCNGALPGVSGCKNIEEKLRLSEEKFSTAFRISPDSININRLHDGMYLEINEGFTAITGYTPEEVVGRTSLELNIWADPEDRACLVTRLSEHGVVNNLEAQFRRKDGSTLTGLMSARIIEIDGELCVLSVSRDISERKEAEAARRKNDERMRLFFERQLVGTAILSPERNWLQVNDKACQILGYTRQELATLPWDELTHPDDHAAGLGVFNRLLAGEIDDYTIEKRFIRKDGVVVNTDISVGCVRHPDGTVDYVLALLEDITQRTFLERSRLEDRRFLQTILDSISDFIFYKDSNGIFLGCNDAYANNYIGLPKERIIGHSDRDFSPDPGLVNRYVESDRQVMASGSPMRLKHWITPANGKRRALIEVLKAPFFDGEGHIAGVIGVARDITEHQLALEAITREKETAQRYLDIAGVMFCALNRDGEIILMNKKGSQILGYQDNELLGKNWFEVCLSEAVREKVRAVFALQMAGNLAPVEFYENTVLNRSGEERLISFHNTLLRGEDGICGVLFSGEDVTEQRMMHDERLKNQKLESLGVLAGGIAHDFNNILSGIMGNISFARLSLENPNKAARLLENAEKASLRAAALASQLLTFAKGGEPIKKIVSLPHLLEESLSLTLRGANVKGAVDISETLRAVEADEGQLSQVFNNLIINALHAMPGGGTLTVVADNLDAEARKRLQLPHDQYVVLRFSDQGCGISEEDQKRIFDPYFTTKPDGSGLGLASVSSIINKHGGRIQVSSAVGKGATFTMYLPSVDGTSHHYQADAVVEIDSDTKGSVLVMDDEEMIRTMTAEMLEYMGYRVTTCEEGLAAVALYQEACNTGKPFTAVIMDLTIPGGVGGKEAAQRILAFDQEARLIVSSGYSNDPIMSDYRTYGFSGAVAKPYNIVKLGQLIGSVC